MKDLNYTVVWSQKFNLTKSKLSIEFKKFFNKSCKAHQPKKEYKVKIMRSIGLQYKTKLTFGTVYYI